MVKKKSQDEYHSLNIYRKNRRKINGWLVAFCLLLSLGIVENWFVVNRWLALRHYMNIGNHAQVWNLLGRSLTDPND
jgi:hypothetical protein